MNSGDLTVTDVACTWGNGPDIIIALEDTRKEQFQITFARWEDAISLVADLSACLSRAMELEMQYTEALKEGTNYVSG